MLIKVKGSDKARRSLYMHPDKQKQIMQRREQIVHSLNQKHIEFSSDGRFFTKPPMDRDSLKKQLRDIDHTIEVNGIPKVDNAEKDRLWGKAKQLVNEIRDGMPTKFEMHPLQLNPATGKIGKNEEVLADAVEKHIDWEARNKQKIIELKNIAYTLGEPKLAEIERLRSGKTSETGRMVTI